MYHNEWAPRLAELLVTLTQREGGLGFATGASQYTNIEGAKVFFSSSGTEANEGAFKIARKVGKDRWAAKTGKGYLDPSCPKYKFAFWDGGHIRAIGIFLMILS